MRTLRPIFKTRKRPSCRQRLNVRAVTLHLCTTSREVSSILSAVGVSGAFVDDDVALRRLFFMAVEESRAKKLSQYKLFEYNIIQILCPPIFTDFGLCIVSGKCVISYDRNSDKEHKT